MPETALRERKKLQSRALLATTALDLFTEFGFDTVTVDQIAERAELSPRTFFRYFGSKEAVLYADQEEMLELLRVSISSRPAEEPPLLALRLALVSLTDHYATNRDQYLQRARLAKAGASLGVYQRTVLIPAWESALAEALADRLGADLELDLRPRLFAGVAMAAMSSAGAVWLAEGGSSDVSELLHRAFDEFEQAVREVTT